MLVVHAPQLPRRQVRQDDRGGGAEKEGHRSAAAEVQDLGIQSELLVGVDNRLAIELTEQDIETGLRRQVLHQVSAIVQQRVGFPHLQIQLDQGFARAVGAGLHAASAKASAMSKLVTKLEAMEGDGRPVQIAESKENSKLNEFNTGKFRVK